MLDRALIIVFIVALLILLAGIVTEQPDRNPYEGKQRPARGGVVLVEYDPQTTNPTAG